MIVRVCHGYVGPSSYPEVHDKREAQSDLFPRMFFSVAFRSVLARLISRM